jgi:hypothetical protein
MTQLTPAPPAPNFVADARISLPQASACNARKPRVSPTIASACLSSQSRRNCFGDDAVASIDSLVCALAEQEASMMGPSLGSLKDGGFVKAQAEGGHRESWAVYPLSSSPAGASFES